MRRLTTLTLFVVLAGTASAAFLPYTVLLPHFTSLDARGYQFRGTTSTGATIPDGAHVLVLSIWDGETAGTQLWSETQTVDTKDGLGSVQLGDVVPIPLDVFGFAGDDTTRVRYLQVSLDGEVISPRTRLGASPYANISERMLGDFETRPGYLIGLSPATSDTAVLLGATASKAETVHIYLKSNGCDVEGFATNQTSGWKATTYGTTGAADAEVQARADADEVLVKLGIEHEDIGMRMHVADDGSGASVELADSNATDSSHIEMRTDPSGGHLAVSNIGSSGEDGVSIEAASGETIVKMGIDSEDLGIAMHASDDGSGAGLMLADSNATDSSQIAMSTDGLGGRLRVSNIGSSGEDGVSIEAAEGATVVKLGIESDDLGIAMHASDDGSGAGLMLADSNATDSSRIAMSTDGLGGRLRVSNIGSTGEDGVSIEAGNGTAVVKLGIEHEDIGYAMHASDDGSAGLAIADSSTSDTSEVQLGHELGHSLLRFSNSGASGNAGLSTGLFNNQAYFSMVDAAGDSAILLTTEPLPSGFTRDSKLFFGDLGSDNDIDMTIDGSVGIGVSDPTNILQVVRNSTTDPVADAWGTYSSRRWKKNVETIDDAIDKLMRLRGVEFDWKDGGKHDIGLIAEEVGKVVPEVVSYEDNGVDARSVDYSRLVALLIEATKEQQATIDRLEALVERLVAEKKTDDSSRDLLSDK